MKHVCSCVGTVMVLAISLSVVRADEPDTYSSVQDLEKARKQRVLSSQNIWWEHLIPGRIEEKQKLAQEAKEAQSAKAKGSSDEASSAKPKTVAASTRQTELNKALRREAVCQRLREIAEETNDPELAKQADLLESRAWAVYEQKVSSASLAKFQPMNDKEVESRLLKSQRGTASDSAQAESGVIRSITGEKKE